jgi:hypothetical protein
MWQAEAPPWFPEEFRWVVGCTYEGMPRAAARIRNMLGCNMSFRRSVFAAVGGFRSGLGRVGQNALGCEETELCIRVHNHWPNGILLFEPAAGVRHRVPRARGTYGYFRSRCYAEGLSKAWVARLVGASDGLSTERRYATQTLPRGVGRSLARAFATRNPSDAGRAAAIVLGLACTTAGFVRGRLSQRSTLEGQLTS